MNFVGLDLPSGAVGMLFGAVAGLVVLWASARHRPWDIHEEKAYREPERITFDVVAPSLVLFMALLILLLGVGALDKGIDARLALVGDVLGLIVLPISLLLLWRSARGLV